MWPAREKGSLSGLKLLVVVTQVSIRLHEQQTQTQQILFMKDMSFLPLVAGVAIATFRDDEQVNVLAFRLGKNRHRDVAISQLKVWLTFPARRGLGRWCCVVVVGGRTLCLIIGLDHRSDGKNVKCPHGLRGQAVTSKRNAQRQDCRAVGGRAGVRRLRPRLHGRAYHNRDSRAPEMSATVGDADWRARLDAVTLLLS